MRKPIIGASALLLAAAVAGCQEKSSASAANMSPARASSSAGGMSSSQAQPAAAGSASGAKPALAKPAAAAGSTTEQAEKLLDQTMTYVKENKLDLAEKSLTAAEKLKPQLPASYSPRIDQARSALDLAKKGSAIGNAVKAPAVK